MTTPSGHRTDASVEPGSAGDRMGTDLGSRDPSGWLPSLTAMLQEQDLLCRGLEALSQRQSQAIAGGDTDALLRVLGERAVIIERVTAINRALEPFRAQREAAMARLSPSQREVLTRVIDSISAIVERIQARDEADKLSIERQRSNVAGELGELSRSRGAIAAYGGATGGVTMGARFQDRQG